MQRILFFLCLLPFWSSVSSADLSGSDSLPGIDRYPNATVVRHGEGDRVNYPLVASAIKKVNGVVRADEEQRLDGSWRRLIYQMPDGHSSEAGFHFFSDRLGQLGVQTLYSCDGRHCGPSNLWANKVFEEANLYGLDKDQFYLLGVRKVDGHAEYYVLYTVRRGNRRVYAMLDQLVVEGSQGQLLASAEKLPLQSTDFTGDSFWDVAVDPVSGMISQQDIDRILAEIQLKDLTQLLLAGSVPALSDLTLEQQLERSRQYAQSVKMRLIDANVDEEQLFVIGTGPLLQEKSGNALSFVRVMVVK